MRRRAAILQICASAWAASLALGAQPATAQADRPSPGIIVVDGRPEAQKKFKVLSFSIFSCSLGIRQLSDEGRPQDRIAKLRTDLNAALGDTGPHGTVEVRDYKLFLNTGTYVAGNAANIAASQAGLSLGVPTPHAEPKCAKDKTPEGWFAPEQTTTGYSPLVIEITVAFAGKAYSVQSVYSPDTELSGEARTLWVPSKAQKNVSDAKGDAYVEAAFGKANKALADALRNGAPAT
jgi:hypothetical protein